MTYLQGSTATIRATFRDIDGDLVDPSSVDLTIQAPDGTQTSEVPTNPSIGVYEFQLNLDQVGWYAFRFEGSTSEGMAVCEGKVCVKASALAVVS